jgi:cell division protein FtsZ
MQNRGRGHGIRVHGIGAARTEPSEQATEPVTPPLDQENQQLDRDEDTSRVQEVVAPARPADSRPRAIMPEEEPFTAFARIKVIGVGGAGGNAINRMIRSGVESIEFVAVNTDAQALLNNESPTAVRIGDKLTKGLGAGGRPEVGERAAEESAEGLADLMHGADMIFITAGMGGGTGTGASPILAKLAKQAGALTVAVVTRPFEFEGHRRAAAADAGIGALRDVVDALITIPNERLLHMVDPKTSITDAFQIADDVLRQGIAGISDLITKPGVINLDFADVKTIMQDAGSALMAIGHGSGENRCIDAAREAIESPLLEMNIQGATGVLYNITGGSGLTLSETSEAAEIIRAAADEDAEIIYGTSIDESLGDGVMITLIATGFDERSNGRTPSRVFGRERAPLADRQRERPIPQEAPVTPAPAPRQPAPAPVMPDDDWDSEPSIIRFLRDR